MQNSDTIEFVNLYNSLWRGGLFKSQMEFCEQIKCSRTSLNLILNGKRNAPVSIILKTKELYGNVKPSVSIENKSNTNDLVKTALEGLIKSTEVLERNTAFLQAELHSANQIIAKYIERMNNPEGKPGKAKKTHKVYETLKKEPVSSSKHA